MDWVPIVFVAFKVLVFGTAMFFAIKWHYDQGKSKKEVRAVLRTSAAVLAVIVLLAVGVVFATFTFAKWLGMDLNLP